MALVVVDVEKPKVLIGQTNGKLSSSILVSTPGLDGGPTVKLVNTAARCWRALAYNAQKSGVILKATSSADSYRSYEVQKRTFLERYQVDPTNNSYRWWDSDNSGRPERWWKKDNVATAAVPGTSNHGWGLAVDVANASGTRLKWLEINAEKFGWSWETVPEEPWHIRNFSGDNIPRTVLEYEKNNPTSPASPPQSNGALDMLMLARVPGNPDTYWLGDGFFHRQLSGEDAAGTLTVLRILYNNPSLPYMQWPGVPVESVLERIGPKAIPEGTNGGALMPHNHNISGTSGPAQPTT